MTRRDGGGALQRREVKADGGARQGGQNTIPERETGVESLTENRKILK